MVIVESDRKNAFAVWVTGLPASGKSTLVAALKSHLADRGVDVAVLESDVLRQVFTPQPHYDEQERDMFYRQMTYVGTLLLEHSVPVVFDATASKRSYRDHAREQIARFLEVFVDSPLEVCVARDPKGIYRKGREGASQNVPGLQANYEPPETPDVLVYGNQETPDSAAERVIAKLIERRYL
jgi:adenylylsulfate kinase